MKLKLSDIAEIVSGATPSTSVEEFYDGDVVWFTPKDLSDQGTKYIRKGERNLTEDGFRNCSARMIPPYNLLMSSRAPIGLLSINEVECCTNQGFKSMIIDKSKANVDYLYYYIKHHLQEVEALGSGTTFKEVSRASLEKWEIDIPDLSVQEAIASVLSSLDRKISLNRKANEVLESMAKQLYDYWFVQFDFPNAEGKPYKSSGGKMVYNETLKREIPEGWEVKTINEISKSVRGVTYDRTDLLKDGVLVLRGNNIQDNHLVYDGNTAYIPEHLVSENQRIKKGDIIMTMSSGSKEHIGKCMMFNYDSDHTFGAFLNCFRPDKDMLYYFFLFLISSQYKAIIKSKCSGTGINNLTNQSFDDIYLPIPHSAILASFETKVKLLYEKYGKNELETLRLTSLRDYLLPLLMNGQVKVL